MRPELATAAQAWQLVMPRGPISGPAGERLGRASGSSLEFMDFRDYAPGDDLRHIDWRGYARTDQLKVRLYREEVSPALDVVLDGSASMRVSERKERAARDLALAACAWSRAQSGTARAYVAGRERLEDPERELESLVFDVAPGAGLPPRVPLRARSLRFVVSDFLTPEDPAPAIRRLAAGASQLWVVQLLDAFELDPLADVGRDDTLLLIDIEHETQLDIVLDERTAASYRARLARLRDRVAQATRAAGGRYACVPAAAPAEMFREALCAARIVEPRV